MTLDDFRPHDPENTIGRLSLMLRNSGALSSDLRVELEVLDEQFAAYADHPSPGIATAVVRQGERCLKMLEDHLWSAFPVPAPDPPAVKPIWHESVVAA